MSQTVLFEEKYKTDIKNFATTEQVTKFLESKLNRCLSIVSLKNNIVSNRGNVFPIKHFDTNKEFDNALKIAKKSKFYK